MECFLPRRIKVINITNSIILVKDCYPALERFWNNYTLSLQNCTLSVSFPLTYWSWKAIEKNCSWWVPLKTRAYSSQLHIWSKTTPLSKLSINESQLKAATKYCNHDSSPEVATYLLHFRFEPWWTNLFPPHTEKAAFKISKGQLNAV